MVQIFRFLSFLLNIYMMIIFVRIILTWFSGMGTGRLQEILAVITDPYLNWFRRFDALRVGFLDLTPIVALGVLSLVNRIFTILARYGTIRIGIILAIAVEVLWGAISFFFGFLIIILILRFIAYLTRQSSANHFWRVVDMISQPVVFRINRFIFRGGIMSLGTAIALSLAVLVGGYVILRIAVFIVIGLLANLPI
jgi:YggT family protein